MKVRIIKAYEDNFWYADKIGEIFDIYDYVEEDHYRVVENYKVLKKFIKKEDCEIIQEKEIKVENKDLDFQVKDKVYCLIYGNGLIMRKNREDDFEIDFKHEGIVIYSKKGIIQDDIFGVNRTLYHGHDLEITVKEKKPERYPWANIFIFDFNGENCLEIYGTEKECKDNIDNYLNTNECWYVDTIQLIPNHLKK